MKDNGGIQDAFSGMAAMIALVILILFFHFLYLFWYCCVFIVKREWRYKFRAVSEKAVNILHESIVK